MTADQYSLAEINQCILVDQSVKKLEDRVAELLDKKAKNAFFFSHFDALELADKQKKLNEAEINFVKQNCRNKIEYSRLKSSAEITTEFAEKTENDVVVKNKNEQLIYISIASAILLASLFMIKKMK